MGLISTQLNIVWPCKCHPRKRRRKATTFQTREADVMGQQISLQRNLTQAIKPLSREAALTLTCWVTGRHMQGKHLIGTLQNKMAFTNNHNMLYSDNSDKCHCEMRNKLAGSFKKRAK